MRHYAIPLLLIMVVCGAGCPNSRRPGEGSAIGRVPHAPHEAPPPPPRQNVPLDPTLLAAADAEFTSALHDSDPIVRVHALEGIRDSNGIRHKADILHALDDTEPVVRFAAALASGEMKIKEAHKQLLAIAFDPSENVRVAVRFALHRLGDTHLSHDLEKMATDSNPGVRGNTAMVLGLLGEPSGLRVLQVLRLDSNPAVRLQASESMWRLGSEEGMKDLIGLTASRYADDQMIGYLGLAWPRKILIRQHVRAGLVGEESAGAEEKWMVVPLVAARAMGMLGSDEGYVIAQKGAASRDPQLRLLAALAFGAIGRSDAQSFLRKLLVDPDANVRIGAASAILELRPPG